jgi:hypothetical protein
MISGAAIDTAVEEWVSTFVNRRRSDDREIHIRTVRRVAVLEERPNREHLVLRPLVLTD